MERIRVTAGIIINNDKVLITRRAPNENFAGGWEFPGGKIEADETPEECLARELKEELNITVSVEGFCTEVPYDYDDISIDLIAYYCTIVDGEIQMSVHDKYKWVKIEDLLNYDLLPADVPIAKRVVKEKGS
ncbi:MAG TPA: 8-oxo-dGTP diphosphatase MutT [Hungateiclostridium thermocellum]|jgi:8-oxo-dGTP diphosphatase|uniref:8-oxo-dGTP diphosphatase n=2 Tax=Acetivibrio thermocellus TaxID=1515 RepID=A3DFI6_ACET2|nr:8-oxo-dGTP diphosphatase MutT [Acetivibrio thermocellus]CDG36151.1 NUDIX hydrolase [Acetivibrio thermocellus BC1]ABN52715.1 NUDIX hydrolase [Acetivibrio thermocellus ATCC 27405]ADU75280.1 NUDIX hydrolase [Acetivibrio thermocellus DSM 1313]ALX09269.1 mutator MutT protein [Acetivibrio thermocellus AD2]ANV77021.1 mutator MutT protein [Acetivibrio thermocellus DSM 2360]